MYVRRKIRRSIIFKFGWRNILLSTLWATAVVISYDFLEDYRFHIGIPFLPISTIGIAVAFYVGFKNNQAYDRFWEGRKIWGGIVNYSRTWANQVLTYLDASDDNSQIVEVQNRLIKRHLAYINALRIQLRSTTIFDRKNVTYVPSFKLPTDRDSTEELLHFLSSEEYDLIMSKVNPATHLNRLQGEELAQLHKDKIINDFQQVNMMDTLKEFYNLQGMAERIKATPFPRQFAYFSNLFIWIFILLLPFGLVEEFVNIQDGNIVYLTIPISALVSWVFYSMESIGDNSEDPFENYINDVPMTAICNTIERDLLQMIDEPIPDKVSPVNDILM